MKVRINSLIMSVQTETIVNSINLTRSACRICPFIRRCETVSLFLDSSFPGGFGLCCFLLTISVCSACSRSRNSCRATDAKDKRNEVHPIDRFTYAAIWKDCFGEVRVSVQVENKTSLASLQWLPLRWSFSASWSSSSSDRTCVRSVSNCSLNFSKISTNLWTKNDRSDLVRLNRLV